MVFLWIRVYEVTKDASIAHPKKFVLVPCIFDVQSEGWEGEQKPYRQKEGFLFFSVELIFVLTHVLSNRVRIEVGHIF